MRKKCEAEDPGSCWNKAADEELIFVLRGTDVASLSAVWSWINERVNRGLDQVVDHKIIDAIGWIEVAMYELEHGVGSMSEMYRGAKPW